MAFPAVLQIAQTECGLGVSASILQHYGRYQTVSDLRLSMEPGREGLNNRNLGRTRYVIERPLWDVLGARCGLGFKKVFRFCSVCSSTKVQTLSE